MPVISSRRYSTTTGSNYNLPPSVGGRTSTSLGSYKTYSTTTGLGSCYQSLSNSSYLGRTPTYRSSLYSSPSSLSGTSGNTSYRHSSYLSGGNNDTANRFGVSNTEYTRLSSDRDKKRLTGKTYNNYIDTNKSKTLITKPPISGSVRCQRTPENSSRENSQTRDKIVSSQSDQNYQSKFGSPTRGTSSSSGTDKHKISSSSLTSSSSSPSLSSSKSLARQVATSGLDLYEKYSPTHYIPKCELSRSRSLSEATSDKYKTKNCLSNSSNNVHQLLQQKDRSNNLTNKLSYKEISTTPLVNKLHNTSITTSPAPSRYLDREGKSSLSRKLSEDSSDDKIQEGLCGLRNIGNTCFMNSVIQCLSHTRELTKFLKCRNGTKSSKDQQILYEFSKLIREMWSSNVRSVTPLDLKSAFSSKHRMYSGYNQQDAQEFLRFFLDSLHCALNTGVKGEYLKIDDNLNDNKKADLNWESYSKVENSVIKDLFVGQLKSTLKCTTCGNTSVTFDPFWDLSVPLPTSSRCKLDACLDFFIREEILDADEMPTCSKCQARRKCTKSLTIQRFPKYLVIHLKRFSETRWSKLSNIVEFPTGEKELNMTGYASNPNCSALYTLYAISNHMGSTAGGHYVALCKHPITKKWHEFNDNVVSNELSETALVSSSAYLLFYERA